MASAGAARPDATCTADWKASLQADAAAYAKQMPAARAAYFKRHKSAKARAAFVKAQSAKLAAFKSAAACTVGTIDSGPLPAPQPSANEHFVFTDEVPQWARHEIEGDVAYAVQDEQALFGVQLNEVTVFVSSDLGWLAQQQCAFYGRGNTCVASTQASYASGNVVGDGPRAIFVNWQSMDWTGRNWDATWIKQKIVGHEICMVLSYQLDGLDGDVGPAWLLFGGSEMVGYRVASDRKMHAYADSLAQMRNTTKFTTAQLQGALTWDGINQIQNLGADHYFLAAAGDRLVADSPNGIRSLATYYSTIAAGRAWPDAFATAFGLSVDAFYAHFTTYRKTL